MKVTHKTLDKVLFYYDSLPDIVQKSKPVSEALNLDKATLDAVLSKFESDGYISNVHRIEEEDGYYAVYFNEKGRAFAATSSYTKEYRKEWPKRNWHWMLLLAGLVTVLLKKVFG
jgi:DNA-binding MarR family transcriptional regulator